MECSLAGRSIPSAGARFRPPRTCVDLACASTFTRGVIAADDALRSSQPGDPRWGWRVAPPTKDDLRRNLLERLPTRGSRIGAEVIDFADALSGSAAESEFRVQFRALKYPKPTLQHPVFDRAGLIGYLDFWFPTLGLGVEVDGAVKYSSAGSVWSPHELGRGRCLSDSPSARTESAHVPDTSGSRRKTLQLRSLSTKTRSGSAGREPAGLPPCRQGSRPDCVAPP